MIYDAGCQESRRVIEDTGRRLCCTMYPVEPGQLKVISRDKVGTHITANLDKDSIRLTIPSQADYSGYKCRTGNKICPGYKGYGRASRLA